MQNNIYGRVPGLIYFNVCTEGCIAGFAQGKIFRIHYCWD